MNILFTNLILKNYSGTEVYIRDLAILFHKRGIFVEVYSPELGELAEEIRKEGINVTDSPENLKFIPDIIHGHHFIPTLDVMLRFTNVPVIYFLHDRTFHPDTPPLHSRIIKYVAVDYNCLDRLVSDNGIAENITSVIYNWVDLSRFKLRKKFAKKPSRALVFSNYASKDNFFQVIREACEQAGLKLDVIGQGFGNHLKHPEEVLGSYDIIFAKAKAAMESLATGAGVIVCDYRGLAEMVNSANFSSFRKYNFGMKTMTRPFETDLIVNEINKYNAEENLCVAELIRKEASFNETADKILEAYHETIKIYKTGEKRSPVHDEKTVYDYCILKNNIYKEQIKHLSARLEESQIIIEGQTFKGASRNFLRKIYKKIFR
jgi:hypothetical protein